MTEKKKDMTEMAQYKASRMDKCVLGGALIVLSLWIAHYFKFGDISPALFEVIQDATLVCLFLNFKDVVKPQTINDTIPKSKFCVHLLSAWILIIMAFLGR